MWRDDEDGDYDGGGGDHDGDGDGDGDDDGDGGEDDGIVLGTYNQNEIGCSAKMLIIKIVSVVVFETSGEVQNEC